jgi:hypothetical protein
MPQITESQFQDSYQEQDLRFINAMEIIGIMRSLHKDWHNRSFSVEILQNDKLRWRYYLWSEETLKKEAELCFICDGDGWITAEITWDGDVKFSTSTTITQIRDQRPKLNEFVHYVTSLKQP